MLKDIEANFLARDVSKAIFLKRIDKHWSTLSRYTVERYGGFRCTCEWWRNKLFNHIELSALASSVIFANSVESSALASSVIFSKSVESSALASPVIFSNSVESSALASSVIFYNSVESSALASSVIFSNSVEMVWRQVCYYREKHVRVDWLRKG